MHTFKMDRWRRLAVGSLAIAVVMSGCDILDPSDVTNPNPTPADLASSSTPTRALLPGLRAQMARAVMGVVQTSAFVSDDFEISFTNVTGELSDPWEVRPDGGSYNSTGAIGAYWHTQELRAFSDFVIDSIAPLDENATDAQLAEAHYFRGMALLMQGENFKAVPTGPDQEPTPWDELLQLAVDNFTVADGLGADEDLDIAITAALARAHRALGNVTEAESFAQAALALDPSLLALQPYSSAEIENPFSLETRTFQPLPRLDFLDPKYTERGSPIPLAKAEEMHLIIAEVEMTRDDYVAAAGRVAEAIRIAMTRPTATLDDQDDRLNQDLTNRPRTSDILVAAEEGAPFRAGLVLDRPGVVTMHTISGTSLDADSVEALSDPQEIRHAFWLARQEIFFLEGRRVSDLGVKMPLTLREIEASPLLSESDDAAMVDVPAFIPRRTIDDFAPRNPASAGTNQVTIVIDMNRVLAEERFSSFGTLP